MNTADNRPRYQTLPDYLPALRRGWYVLVIFVALAIGLSVIYSAGKKPTYQATAKLRFQDATADFGLVGLAGTPAGSAIDLARAGAQTLTGPNVLGAVKQTLGTSLSEADLARSVTAQVEASSILVDVTASARTADFAARLANAVASQVTADAAHAAGGRFRSAASALQVRLRATKDATARALIFQDISRLQTLASIARPARIAQHAVAPKSPSSPRPVLYGVIAAILGLLAGFGAVLLRESFDRRMRSASEIQNEVHLPLLGHLHAAALGHSLDLLTAVKDGAPTPTAEAFRIIRQNLRFVDAEAPSRTILVTSAVPAEGKTTVAIGLAVASASAGSQTLLVECDLRRPALAKRLDIRGAPGLTDHLAGTVSLQDILQPVATSPSPNGAARPAPGNRELVCIAAGTPSSEPAEMLAAPPFTAFLEQAVRAFDVVILDSCPLLPVVDTLELLPLVDRVVLCVRAAQTKRDQVIAGTTAIAHFPPKPTGLVITGTSEREGDGYYGYGYNSESPRKRGRRARDSRVQ